MSDEFDAVGEELAEFDPELGESDESGIAYRLGSWIGMLIAIPLLERRAIDAVFRACPVVAIPGYSRPMIRVEDYVQLVTDSTYDGSRVRP